MNIETISQYCLSKKGAVEDFPFDEETLVFKVGGKMFALIPLEKIPLQINLKCDPEKAEELRAEYDGIRPGYHMSKVHWNSVDFNKDVSTKMICELINHSYDLVFKSLTKKVQAEINEIEN